MTESHLPQPLPEEPFALFAHWFAEAERERLQPNPNAMVLATVDGQGMPAARIVLCKEIQVSPGYLVFFTNYLSAKGKELELQPRAAVVFHWDALHRQVRMTGRVVKSPASESENYFARRPVASRIAAWASRQSQPLSSREQLAAQVEQVEARFGVRSDATQGHLPRPPHWGGYRLWPETVELWMEGANRVHDRAQWMRTLTPSDAVSFIGGGWTATRLNP